MHNGLIILGSTGSIGTQALEVARALDIQVAALTAHSNIGLLERQIREFKPKIAAVTDEAAAAALRIKTADTSTRIAAGMDGLCEAACADNADIVLNAIVGMAGLRPTLAAIRAKKTIALANKETLVAGGQLVTGLAAEYGVNILPVDSEHSAVFQCLQTARPDTPIRRIILTASGGPFFSRSRAELASVTREQALKHPNWDMGAKISIDSATLMNKGLEIIEAVHLFDVPAEKIDVVVHRESVIHSMVEFEDNSVLAQMGVPDMRVPIQYALTYPERYPSAAEPLDLAKTAALTFAAPDEQTFPCLRLCREAAEKGGLMPAAVNAANEEAVRLFLDGRIEFLDIAELVENAANSGPWTVNSGQFTLDDVFEADTEARRTAKTFAL